MLSIIIPVLNEEQFLPRLLSQLETIPNSFIIIVDGGSTDQTLSITEKSSARLIRSPKKGRSVQLNAGAQAAKGDYMLFLHADVVLPENFSSCIEAFMKQGGSLANFQLEFDWGHWLLKFSAFFTCFRLNSLQFGDQGLLICSKLFDEIGGYDEAKQLLEDQDLIRRATKKVKLTKLPTKLIVSARKYRQYGAIYLQFTYCIIYLCYRLKFSDIQLQRMLNRMLVKKDDD